MTQLMLEKGWNQMSKCPRCEKTYEGYPSLSRRDNKTDICSDCGTVEAIEDYTQQPYDGKIYWEVK